MFKVMNKKPSTCFSMSCNTVSGHTVTGVSSRQPFQVQTSQRGIALCHSPPNKSQTKPSVMTGMKRKKAAFEHSSGNSEILVLLCRNYTCCQVPGHPFIPRTGNEHLELAIFHLMSISMSGALISPSQNSSLPYKPSAWEKTPQMCFPRHIWCPDNARRKVPEKIFPILQRPQSSSLCAPGQKYQSYLRSTDFFINL